MSKLSIILYGFSLLLIFSPAFLYLALKQAGILYPSIMTQVVSIVPFIIGIGIIAIMRVKKI